MARSASKEFGESLKYDPTFKGPLHRRSCTDVICLMLFIFFIGAWVVVGIYAFKYGDPARLVTPTDSEGQRCGLDDSVRDKPFLFFFDLTKCAAENVIINGCPTPQICVKECPTENFFFNIDKAQLDPSSDWKRKLICKDEVFDSSIATPDLAQDQIDKKMCAKYYLESKEVQGRCIPIDNIDAKFVINTVVSGGVELLFSIVGNITDDLKYREMGHKIVQDLSDSWPFVVGGLGLAMVLCLIYIVLMRWFAGVMVWLSLIGVIALLSYCCYASYVKYAELKAAELKTAEQNVNSTTMRSRVVSGNLLEPAKEQLDQLLTMKDTWLTFLIISAILLVIILLLLIFLRSRIRIAIALIKEASKAVGSIMSTLAFPLFPWVLQLCVLGWFVAVLLFLAGSTQPVYKALFEDPNDECITPNGTYTNGDVCDPDTFDACAKNNKAVCQFFTYKKEKYVDYLHAVNIFGIFWGLFFISALGEMILAATFATWYWTYNKSNVPFLALTISIGRTFRYHLGTVAFGSLILAICRIIRVILEYINHKLKKYDNIVVKAIMCCLRCFFWCLENFIKFINRNAYIMCAIHGKNFCLSAKDAFNLLMRNVIRVFVLDKVTDFLLFLGKLMITAGMCALAFFVFTKELTKYEYVEVPTLNYSIVPVLIIGFGTYFIANIFFGVYAMAVDTLFLCFLEDCERNDGSPEKPYFMSKELMKILRKKNK